ncbi:PREDICTED: protein NRT1/ PTR FAMILY 2.8 isoform X1 [Ipomoea nil]|uniref:protein NRT1/ PTR FAMILY 2.8 isoform X1 n=2 Tax=Ipomoea nil TaxID=35883 RepID=UPI000900D8AE|nr:PREDICTED: protein NRT1/ PTR FAMILY 2.8 isoform X1 [Ipomoea nil]
MCSLDSKVEEREMEIRSHSASTTEEEPITSIPTRSRGGWKAIMYILANEAFEKLASMSLISNMTVYLRTKYNLGGVFLVNVVTVWNGTSNISTLGGAFVSDAYLGRFLTLFFGTICSLIGMGTVTLTAGLASLRPPACHDQSENCKQPHGWQLAILYIGLAFLSLGSGGIRPCNIAFGADQFDTDTPKGRAQLESFINWWYFSFTIALLIVLTGVIYIQTEVSWTIGFAIPTFCLLLSLTIFLLGRHAYVYKKPQGSVFVDLTKVVVAFIRKRHVELGEGSLYDPATEEPKLPKTERFMFLNKAAVIVDGDELDEQGVPRNTWTLCSIHQVEQLKCLFGILPVWVSGLGCFVVMDQQGSFGNLQAIQMNKSIGSHFQVPPAWMGISSMIALTLWILVYERFYILSFKKILNRDVRMTAGQKISAGIVTSILCMVAAGVVEEKRRSSALKHHTFESPLSIALLLPQFILSGMTEALAAVAIMEFFTTQIPEALRSLGGSVFFLSLSFSSYLSSLIVNVIHAITVKTSPTPWLGGHDLNKNRLEYYYYIIACIAALNFLYYTLFASKYVAYRIEDASEPGAMEDSSLRLTRNLELRDEETGSHRTSA